MVRFHKSVQDRLKQFAATLCAGGQFEQYRIAVVLIAHGFFIHHDNENDPLPGLGWVAIYNRIVEVGGERYRLSVIGYSRGSVGSYLRRSDLYSRVCDRAVQWYHGQPQARKETVPEMLHTDSDVASRAPPKASHANFNKLVYYAAASTMLHAVLRSWGIDDAPLDLDNHSIHALLIAATLDPHPARFHSFAQMILAEGKREDDFDGPLAVVKAAVRYFRAQEKGSLPKGQRFQMVYGKGFGSDGLILKTLDAVKRARSAAWHHVRVGSGMGTAFDGTLKVIREDCTFYRDLMGQHLICVGALLGLFPQEFLSHARIAHDAPSFHTVVHYAPHLETTDDKQWAGHSYQVLSALACILKKTMAEMENMVCEWGRDTAKLRNPAAHNIRARDLVFPGQPLPFIEDGALFVWQHGCGEPTRVLHPRPDGCERHVTRSRSPAQASSKLPRWVGTATVKNKQTTKCARRRLILRF